MTNQAEAAKAIRAELKVAFPETKFSVRSKSFAGGDDVSISWDDGPKTLEVSAITDKYQYGHFDGMDDSYRYSNNREDIPQSKYVMCQRHISDETHAKIKADLAKRFAIDMDDEVAVQAQFHAWSDQVIYREFSSNFYSK